MYKDLSNFSQATIFLSFGEIKAAVVKAKRKYKI